MKQDILKGSDLLLSVKDTSTGTYTPLAYATSHSVNITRESRDISSKQSGVWNDAVAGNIGWEIQCETLFSLASNNYSALFDMLVKGENVYVTSGLRQLAGTTDAPYLIDTSTGATYYKGTALLTNLSLSAGSKDNMTMSATLQGAGPLVKVTA